MVTFVRRCFRNVKDTVKCDDHSIVNSKEQLGFCFGSYGKQVGPQGRVQDLWKRGFICIKVWEFAWIILSIFLKYQMK